MSTYYHAACDKHRVVSRVLGGRSFPDRWWSNDDGELEEFLEAHGDCKPNPQIVSEHDDRTLDYDELGAVSESPSPVPGAAQRGPESAV